MPIEQLTARNRYLSIPFRMGRAGAQLADRQGHIRDQITQLLYTQPGERVFLPQFGIGLAQLLFLPMTNALWRRIEVTLSAGLAEALAGEVLSDSLLVRAGPLEGDAATLRIVIRYRLAALNLSEEMRFDIAEGMLALPEGKVIHG